jgi:hypothetical protein
MPADDASARRLVPADYLAYPVLLTLKTKNTLEYGCGFYLTADNAIYLITAKHLLAEGLLPADSTGKVPQAELELRSWSASGSGKRVVMTADFAALRQGRNVKPHPSQDVVAVKLAVSAPPLNTAPPGGNRSASISLLRGVTMKESTANDLLAVPADDVVSFDQVAVGNDAIVYGYPILLGMPSNVEFDPALPVLGKALVAGRDAEKHSIVVEGAHRGSSGGPVFELDPDGGTYKLAGIIIDSLDANYSLAKPVDFVLGLIH